MKKIIVFISVLFFLNASFAQPADFKEGQPLSIEGIEFIYTVGVETVKNIGGADYSFFSVDWYITNKGKFSKIFLLEKEKIVENPEFDMTKKAYLGKIHVINALQLETTKKFDVISSEANMEVMVYAKAFIGNKKKALEGFNLQSGQSLTSSILVAVPKGQRPIVSLQPFISPYY